MAHKNNTKTIIIVVLGVIAASLLGFAVSLKYSHSKTVTKDTYYPKAPDALKQTPKYTPSPVAATKTTPSTSSTPASSDSGQVTITSPVTGATVTDGTKVTGHVAGGISGWYYRIKGSKSGQVALGPIPVDSSGNFSFTISLTNQLAGGSDQAELNVYQQVSGGPETNIVSILVMVTG